MAIPDFEGIMRPLLVHLSDGKEHGAPETREELSRTFGLTEEERRQPLPSGKQPLFTNRVAWAKFYLKRAGCVDNPRRGFYRITDRGNQLLKSHSGGVDIKVLHQFPEFREFLVNARQGDASAAAQTPSSSSGAPLAAGIPSVTPEHELTPEELLETGHSRLTGQLAVDLLDRIKQSSPEFFEELVIDLLLALGYGGSRRDAGRTVGRTGDGGIDGVISEDRLGLDMIYIQAKRWEGTVGRPELQKFAGALQGQKALKGIFITSSTFTREAVDFARSIGSRIVLIDGEQLSRLMIEHDVGVAVVASYQVKRVDSDYFAEE
jgi:restriction system protein